MSAMLQAGQPAPHCKTSPLVACRQHSAVMVHKMHKIQHGLGLLPLCSRAQRRRGPRGSWHAPRAAFLQAAAAQGGHAVQRAAVELASWWAATAAQAGAAPAAVGSGSTTGALLSLANLATALQPACFDAACKQEKDLLLATSLIVPLLVLAAAVAYLLRPPPQGSFDDGSMFEDQSTGTLFEAPPGAAPERDRRGELAFRAISYTPWPVEEGVEGERVRLDVGAVGERQPRTFVFSKVLPQPSQLVVTTLERPLGIVFEEDARRKRVVVDGFVPGGHAEQVMKRARLNPALAATAPMEGDVLRACTCTNIVYQPAALAFGMQQPKRTVVVYGADGQGWPQTIAALQKGLVADGPVTLILERRLRPDEAAAAGSAAAGGTAAAAAASGAGSGRQET